MNMASKQLARCWALKRGSELAAQVYERIRLSELLEGENKAKKRTALWQTSLFGRDSSLSWDFMWRLVPSPNLTVHYWNTICVNRSGSVLRFKWESVPQCFVMILGPRWTNNYCPRCMASYRKTPSSRQGGNASCTCSWPVLHPSPLHWQTVFQWKTKLPVLEDGTLAVENNA